MSRDSPTLDDLYGPGAKEADDEAFESDSPYCECDNEPDEEELASSRCKCCGKEITP